MTIDELTKAMNTIPFRPFTLFCSDGRSFRIVHPEFIMRSGTGRIVVVSEPDMKTVELLDLMHVNSIQYQIDPPEQAQAG